MWERSVKGPGRYCKLLLGSTGASKSEGRLESKGKEAETIGILCAAAELPRTVRRMALLLGVFENEPRTSYAANFFDLVEQRRSVVGEIVWMLDGVSVQRLHIC
jgi:hypothetical protein